MNASIKLHNYLVTMGSFDMKDLGEKIFFKENDFIGFSILRKEPI
jgi:hypothetical protein